MLGAREMNRAELVRGLANVRSAVTMIARPFFGSPGSCRRSPDPGLGACRGSQIDKQRAEHNDCHREHDKDQMRRPRGVLHESARHEGAEAEAEDRAETCVKRRVGIVARMSGADDGRRSRAEEGARGQADQKPCNFKHEGARGEGKHRIGQQRYRQRRQQNGARPVRISQRSACEKRDQDADIVANEDRADRTGLEAQRFLP